MQGTAPTVVADDLPRPEPEASPFGALSGYIRWPTSRKLVWLGAIGIAASLLAGGVNLLIHRLAIDTTIDLPLLNGYIGVWIIAQLAVTLINLPAARAGREGRATAYAFVAVQSLFMVGLLHLFGTLGTPLVAIYPCLVILWLVCLDERLGLFGLATMSTGIAVVGVLEAQGWLSYAPVMRAREIDALRSPVWFATVYFHLLVLIGVCALMGGTLLVSWRRQAAALARSAEAMALANGVIRRYVPAQLADQILAGDYRHDQAPRRRRLTIVFSDVEGYTAACEALDPAVIEQVLNRYLNEMLPIADAHGGTVNQIVGDGIMFLFGAPLATNDRDHAMRAAEMALAMQQRTAELCDLWREHGHDRAFRIRIGINTGEASVGDFGSAARKLYSGIGLQTNIAERIQTISEPGEVLISESTFALIGRELNCTPLGPAVIKGLREPLPVYRLDGVAAGVPARSESASVSLPPDGLLRAPC